MRKATERKVEDFFTVQDDILVVLRVLQERLDALEAAHDSLRDRLDDLMGEVEELRSLLEAGGFG